MYILKHIPGRRAECGRLEESGTTRPEQIQLRQRLHGPCQNCPTFARCLDDSNSALCQSHAADFLLPFPAFWSLI